MPVSFPDPFLVLQRLPIRKKIFWSDLGVARKIYRNLALMPLEAPEDGMTRPTEAATEEEGVDSELSPRGDDAV
jgi:hypothetical protein